jgi:branched-subunit amino acid aminotransferase/4-amino-4-deoxychorismate lyase
LSNNFFSFFYPTTAMMYLNDHYLREVPKEFEEISRAIFYSDALFETIRVVKGRALLLDNHIIRLKRGLDLLGMQWPAHWTSTTIAEQIQRGFPGSVRLRWTVWRKPGGWYAPSQSEVGYSMTAVPLDEDVFNWPTQAIQLGICAAVHLPIDAYSGLKTLNAARYVQAARLAKLQGWDDALLLNGLGRVAEATSSNLFWWEGTELRTIALSEGCVAGVFRAFLLEQAPDLGIPVKEVRLETAELDSLNELFLTNSIRGIVPAQLEGTASRPSAATQELARQLYLHLGLA